MYLQPLTHDLSTEPHLRFGAKRGYIYPIQKDGRQIIIVTYGGVQRKAKDMIHAKALAAELDRLRAMRVPDEKRRQHHQQILDWLASQ